MSSRTRPSRRRYNRIKTKISKKTITTYIVNQFPPIISVLICIHFTAHTRANHSAVHIWPTPILLRERHRRRRLSIPFPCPIHTDNDVNNSAHRGKLASDILTCRWEVEEFNTPQRFHRLTLLSPNFTHACGSSLTSRNRRSSAHGSVSSTYRLDQLSAALRRSLSLRMRPLQVFLLCLQSQGELLARASAIIPMVLCCQ